jgi:hypothetical protein
LNRHRVRYLLAGGDLVSSTSIAARKANDLEPSAIITGLPAAKASARVILVAPASR